MGELPRNLVPDEMTRNSSFSAMLLGSPLVLAQQRLSHQYTSLSSIYSNNIQQVTSIDNPGSDVGLRILFLVFLSLSLRCMSLVWHESARGSSLLYPRIKKDGCAMEKQD